MSPGMAALWPALAAAPVAGAVGAAVVERHCRGLWRSPPLRTMAAFALAAAALAAWAASETAGAALWLSCALGWVLLVLAETDRRTMLLPDSLTLPLVACGLLAAWWLAPARLLDHAIGATAGFTALALIGWLYRHVRGREGLGLGDAKLLAAAGAWLGWAALPGVVVVAGASALAVALAGRLSGRPLAAGDALPFGPYLALGVWLGWLYGPIAFEW
jgi:leader peptidase (prepilin peptidase)/N-methyltransferase